MRQNISYLIKDLTNWVKESLHRLGNLCPAQGLVTDVECDYKYESDLSRLANDIKGNINEHIDEVKEAFRNWQSKREESIKVIEELNTTLRDFAKGTNVAKVTGASVGIAGGIMTIAGLVLIPFTGGISTVLTVAGIATGSTGAATGIIASLTRLIAEQVKKSDLEKILRNDDLATEQFYRVLVKFIVRITDLKDRFKTTINGIESVGGFASVARTLKNIFEAMEIFKKFDGNPEIEKAVRIIRELLGAAGVPTTAGVMQAFSGWPGALSKCGTLVGGAGAAIGIGFSVLSLVMSSIEIHKGNPSKLADAVESNILTKLKEELKFYEDIMNVVQREEE